MFQRKDAAYTALATCYSYLPQNDALYASFVLLTDEVTTPFAKEPNSIKMMKGEHEKGLNNLKNYCETILSKSSEVKIQEWDSQKIIAIVDRCSSSNISQ